MRILFVGEPGDIRAALDLQLQNQAGLEVVDCPFSQFSASKIDDGVHLVIVGCQTRSDADLVDDLLGESSGKLSSRLVIFAREPTGNHVLNWLRSGAAAVELWPCQSSRIAFLIDYLSIGTRLKSQQRMDGKPSSQKSNHRPDQVIAASSAMQHVIDQIDRVAALDINVLLTGETGVGKTHLARLLHDQGRKNQAPFIAVNCGALPENLLESELFGHRKGAFTGADSDRKGRFEEVGRGTLFLDEVDAIPLCSQCKLLRAVDNRLFEPLGSNKSIKFRGRLLTASNSQLEKLIEEGKFRADLFYRLGVVELAIPPLRQRREDIRPIAEATLLDFANRNRLSARSFAKEVLALLEKYTWPGNVRQLRNVVESSASLCRGEQIELTDLSGRWVVDAQKVISSNRVASTPPLCAEAHKPWSESRSSNVQSSALSLAEARAKVETDRIRSALCAVGNNRTKAALRLGISRTMLYKKIAKYGLANSEA